MTSKAIILLIPFSTYKTWDLLQLYLMDDQRLFTEAISLSVLIFMLTAIIRKQHNLLQNLDNHEQRLEISDIALNPPSTDLSTHIQNQFESWRLTPSEKEIALLLIKGLSLEEIATVRKTSSKTVRQHAVNIYAKAEIEGRHQLAAYFIEDLLTPPKK
ncbi:MULTISPECIES: helix-turn-helix transcriptional regulator [Pseudomonas]|uniref:helix-turn-helix transcriptional regulator n=1 Tax=Pseudomonas TaxID=286 RepID=UPI00236043F7|nr:MULTISPECIES: LuxR C-terminal-related transcriptional regulator [Pseudomonas]WJV24459.1 LuxR C-terminal-related transcriptional regulator [Pseudomonas chlororaphis]